VGCRRRPLQLPALCYRRLRGWVHFSHRLGLPVGETPLGHAAFLVGCGQGLVQPQNAISSPRYSAFDCDAHSAGVGHGRSLPASPYTRCSGGAVPRSPGYLATTCSWKHPWSCWGGGTAATTRHGSGPSHKPQRCTTLAASASSHCSPTAVRLTLEPHHSMRTPSQTSRRFHGAPREADTSPSPTLGDIHVLFFDGGSRGNPGPGGSGACVVRVAGPNEVATLVWSAAMSEAHRSTTTNQAEYGCLLERKRRSVTARPTSRWLETARISSASSGSIGLPRTIGSSGYTCRHDA
jgi:hypothetical protein